jgi:SnoaL-like domain
VTPYDALRELLQRYSRAADARDVPALAALFHPDAEIVGARGAQSLDQWLESMSAPRPFPSSMHLIGDPLIDLDEGSDRATMDTYAVVYQLSDPTTTDNDLTLGIHYLDEAVPYQGGWVFRRRQSVTLWMR